MAQASSIEKLYAAESAQVKVTNLVNSKPDVAAPSMLELQKRFEASMRRKTGTAGFVRGEQNAQTAPLMNGITPTNVPAGRATCRPGRARLAQYLRGIRSQNSPPYNFFFERRVLGRVCTPCGIAPI